MKPLSKLLPAIVAFVFVIVAAVLLVTSKEPVPLHIVSGSENKMLEPILQAYAEDNDIELQVTYLGSVDIMLGLEQGEAFPYDAVWPANSLWLRLGDKKGLVKHEQSIMRSPVVFGVKKSVAQSLGWVNKNVSLQDIVQAAQQNKLRFGMTSATQSNSGASAYIGFLHAMAGSPEVLTADDLNNPTVQAKTKALLAKVERSSGSSGWLKELFLRNPDKLDAMVNYEALIIEANQQLTRENKEPLCAIYPTDAITIADSPLGYLNKGDATKEEAFLKLQAHLLTPDVQNTIKSMGRRTGLVGLDASDVDSNVFNPDWCIDVNRVISPVPIPDEPVIQQALSMYQGVLRKPSFTVFALDFSGSMEGEGVRDLKQSISSLLDPQQASRFLLQPSQDDITVLLPFNHAPATPIIVKGNDPAELEAAKNTINNLSPKGGTNIYRAAEAGLSIMKSMGVENYLPSIILLTDGRSDGNDAVLKAKLMKSYLGKDVPIFSITFGKAVKDQLEELANASSGRVFNGHKGLMKAFRAAKGYN